jgi:hypothetical protein
MDGALTALCTLLRPTVPCCGSCSSLSPQQRTAVEVAVAMALNGARSPLAIAPFGTPQPFPCPPGTGRGRDGSERPREGADSGGSNAVSFAGAHAVIPVARARSLQPWGVEAGLSPAPTLAPPARPASHSGAAAPIVRAQARRGSRTQPQVFEDPGTACELFTEIGTLPGPSRDGAGALAPPECAAEKGLSYPGPPSSGSLPDRRGPPLHPGASLSQGVALLSTCIQFSRSPLVSRAQWEATLDRTLGT